MDFQVGFGRRLDLRVGNSVCGFSCGPTDLGAWCSNKVEFELRELAPGVSSDDIRLRMRNQPARGRRPAPHLGTDLFRNVEMRRKGPTQARRASDSASRF